MTRGFIAPLIALLLLTSCGGGSSDRTLTAVNPKCAKDSAIIDFELATFVTPRNFPEGLFSQDLMNEYYVRTAQVGCYVGAMINWSETDNQELKALHEYIIGEARDLGFNIVLQSNLLNRSANDVGTPGSVSGNSFTQSSVRKAYKKHLLYLASLEPDILLVAVELNNLLANGNQVEFDAFKQFSAELYAAIKRDYPDITVSISFQWDIFTAMGNFTELQGFESSLDLYSFTSYPTLFGISSVAGIPGGANYYTAIRDHLPPNARVGMAENGWSSADFSSENQQREFYRKLPELYGGLAPEYVVISYLHDYPLPENPSDLLYQFSSMGLFDASGEAKPAYRVVTGYY